jgi:hypothetical protein
MMRGFSLKLVQVLNFALSNTHRMKPVLSTPFTNVQLELLKTFSHKLSEKELMELQKTLAQFFAKRLTQQAAKVWDKKKWTDKSVDAMLVTKMRKAK